MQDLVSVIVPVYNAEKYVQDCIKSIVGQTYKNIELILVDDKSTDHSLALMHKMQECDTRIRIVCHECNSGPGATRNTGISCSLGKWIFFVDSDDIIQSDMIETMVSCAEENDVECVVCNFDSNRMEGYFGEPKLISQEEYRQQYFEMFPPTTYVGSNCNKCYKSDIIKEHALFFDSEERFAEDFRFHVNYMDYVSKIYILPETFYLYNQHEQSLTTSGVFLEDGLMRYERLMEFGYNKFSAYMSEDKRKRYRSGYLRVISNTVFDTVNGGGNKQRIYQDMCKCFAAPFRKTMINEMKFDARYPDCIVWILMKLRMYKSIVYLFSLAYRIRK